MITLPALALPGSWLLAHAILFAASAALLVVVTLVGQLVAWGFGLGRDYSRGQ